MLRTIEVKLYPSTTQRETLATWLRTSCWVYNQALENRIKRHKRRGESSSFYGQSALLTEWRQRIERIHDLPVEFARDALRRVDRGMLAFFRRCKDGEKPGFPRFRSHVRYNSLEILVPSKYLRASGHINIPKLGLVRCRGHKQRAVGVQKLLRVILRASGWFAQVLWDDGLAAPAKRPVENTVGIDLGLIHFAAMSNGETVAAPRFLKWSARKLRSAQRRMSRRVKGGRNRRKAVHRVRLIHERTAAQRRNFAHQLSTDLVRRFDLIAIEELNVKGLASGMLARSVHDAAWSMFTNQLERKAECAGATVVKVDPRGTSQTCPACGHVAKKELSERTHSCERCDLILDRDVAAARVILARALGDSREQSPVEASVLKAEPAKREVLKPGHYLKGKRK